MHIRATHKHCASSESHVTLVCVMLRMRIDIDIINLYKQLKWLDVEIVHESSTPNPNINKYFLILKNGGRGERPTKERSKQKSLN